MNIKTYRQRVSKTMTDRGWCVIYQRNGGSGGTSSRRQPQQHQSRQTAASSSSSSSQHSFRNVDNQMVNLIMNEIMDHGPHVGFDDIGLCPPVIIGRIADLSRPSVCPVRVSKSRKRKRVEKSKLV